MCCKRKLGTFRIVVGIAARKEKTYLKCIGRNVIRNVPQAAKAERAFAVALEKKKKKKNFCRVFKCHF